MKEVFLEHYCVFYCEFPLVWLHFHLRKTLSMRNTETWEMFILNLETMKKTS